MQKQLSLRIVACILLSVALVSGLSVTVSAEVSQSSSELLTNGGFENGLTGWNVWGNVRVVANQYHTPSHSTILGYLYTKGQLSQQFTIPRGATGEISLWYLVLPEQGPILTVALLAQDGSLIQRWVIDPYFDWQEFSYLIDSSHSGESLTLVLVSSPTQTRSMMGKIATAYTYVYVDDVNVISSIPIPEFPNFLVILGTVALVSIFLRRRRTDQTK